MGSVVNFLSRIWRFLYYILTCSCVPEDIRKCRDMKKRQEKRKQSKNENKVEVSNPIPISQGSNDGSIYNGSSSGYGTSYKINSPQDGYYLEEVTLRKLEVTESTTTRTLDENLQSNLQVEEHIYCTCDDVYDEPSMLSRYENEDVHRMMQSNFKADTKTKTIISSKGYAQNTENYDDFDEGIEKISNENISKAHRYENDIVSNQNENGIRRHDVRIEIGESVMDENIYGEYKAKFGNQASTFKNLCREMKGLRSSTDDWTPSKVKRSCSRIGY